tara:strand:- start:149 stop:667 length:519 start_codon:yes stop_codon:yes gene_type:complete
MKSNFTVAINALLQPGREGGFSNNPADPGGMTNLGVTKRVWEEWVGHPVTESDMRALTPLTVAPLYKRRYWDTIDGDNLPEGVDYAVFDCAVNSGPGRAAKFLQKVLNATQDGSIGPITINAVNAANPKEVIISYNETRLNFMKELPTWETFKNGWSRRVSEVTIESTAMIA